MALVVVTGGARSGKSTAAQRMAESRVRDGSQVTVAVFGREDGSDPEFSHRVRSHRAARPAEFETLEIAEPLAWTEHVHADSLLLVDCLGTLLGLVMEDAFGQGQGSLGDAQADSLPAGYEAVVEERFSATLDALLLRTGDTIVVTNEVGDGVVPSWASGRLFRDVLGRANRRLVAQADAAYLCVAGRLVDLSVLPDTARWPEG
jgi:adenosylcobinamide kinase / adenosylcobinamide-phosphate guanylyltransferase